MEGFCIGAIFALAECRPKPVFMLLGVERAFGECRTTPGLPFGVLVTMGLICGGKAEGRDSFLLYEKDAIKGWLFEETRVLTRVLRLHLACGEK